MRNLHWFRADLRVTDNKALTEAILAADELLTVFIMTPKTWLYHDVAPVKIQFILNNLTTLSATLAKQGIPLLISQVESFTNCPKALQMLCKKHHINRLYFNKQYEWDEQQRDAETIKTLERNQVVTYAYDDQTILPPGTITNKHGNPLKIFTPFKKRWLLNTTHPATCKPVAKSRKKFFSQIKSDPIPTKMTGFYCSNDLALWPAGEKKARQLLDEFCSKQLMQYHLKRDYPALDGTSRLSPYLTQGIISPRQCIQAIINYLNIDSLKEIMGFPGPAIWLSELIWRDFYKHIMYHFPQVCWHKPLRKNTEQLNWHTNTRQFQAWCNGQTGFPIVDAAMRQLNQIGWMHNRLRMVTAMFLAKILFLDWRWGERYFMQNLIDGDLSANNGGWQWCASTGTDAVPYFRIFSPMLQSKRFDAEGIFIKQYCPELASLTSRMLHDPYQYQNEFKKVNYPAPIVDYKNSRKEVIYAFKKLR